MNTARPRRALDLAGLQDATEPLVAWAGHLLELADRLDVRDETSGDGFDELTFRRFQEAADQITRTAGPFALLAASVTLQTRDGGRYLPEGEPATPLSIGSAVLRQLAWELAQHDLRAQPDEHE